MKIAVLMSTYNGERFIREQIESILNQKGDFDLNLIVRDDGSSDKTKTILAEYARCDKLKWYEGKNIGPAKSFIELLTNYREYDYYAFSDQDDVWNFDKISRALQKIGKSLEPRLYCSNAELVDSDLKPLGRSVYKAYPKLDLYTVTCAGGLLGCTMVFNSELARKIWAHEKPDKIVLHDFYMAVLCKAVGGEIVYDSYSSMKYRQHEKNVVGVAATKKNIIKNRIRSITCKKKVGIAEQCGDLLRYDMSDKNRAWIKRVSNYKSCFIRRLTLACSRKTQYINRNISIKLRLSILLGNR